MDRRLIPVNAFIALTAQSGASFPRTLGEIGFRLEALEVPLNTEDGRVVADAVAFNPVKNEFLVAECKSGSNIETAQAQKYGKIDPKELVRTTGVTVQESTPLTVQVCYVCLSEGADGIQTGLAKAKCDYPIIEVGDKQVALRNGEAAPDLIEPFGDGLPAPGPPAAIIRLDDESPPSEFDSVVAASLLARVARGDEIISIPDLAADAVPHLPIYGTRQRGQIEKSVGDAAQRICASSPENFEYRGNTSVRPHGVVRIIDSPEKADPRGRTQRYQALRNRVAGAKAVDVPSYEQGGLFDDVDLSKELAKLEESDPPEGGEE